MVTVKAPAIMLNAIMPRKMDNPFPGLRSYEISESDYFFGRTNDISNLAKKLRTTRFLSVVGASGCGKSSVVKAGIIALLRDGFILEEEQRWRFAVMRPWQNPIHELAYALGSRDVLNIAEQDATIEDLQEILRRGSLGIIEAVKKWNFPCGDKLLILVDQFEELFSFMEKTNVELRQDDLVNRKSGALEHCEPVTQIERIDEARAFVKLLLEATRQPDFPIYVVLTMRSEFLGKTVKLPGLPEAINQGLYLLPQLDREQFRSVIERPIKKKRARINERLVDMILNDLSEAEDELPRLQHALMRLWDQWKIEGSERIEIDHFNKIGTFKKALSKHINEVYENVLNDKQRTIAETIFRGITDTTEGETSREIVRNKLKLKEIYALVEQKNNEGKKNKKKLTPEEREEVDEVIREFHKDRRSFLLLSEKRSLAEHHSANLLISQTENQNWSGETDVDISHESLIRQWELLQQWANEEAARREIYKQIRASARLWDERKKRGREEKEINEFLYRGIRLIEAVNWKNDNPGKLNSLELEFIEASQKLHDKELVEKRDQAVKERIGVEAENQSKAIESGAANVFFSFAREDQIIVERLQRKLAEAGNVTFNDWKILQSEESLEQIENGIRAADAFVFIISRASISSEFCKNELNRAVEYNKRIIPVELERVDFADVPESLQSLMWIKFDKRKLDGIADSLRIAIGSDLDWAKAHARLLVQATEWKKNEREASFLLTGKNLQDAEQMVLQDNDELPLNWLQKEYIQASRNQAALNQKNKMRVAMIALAVCVLLLLSTIGATVWAFDRNGVAEIARQNAETAEQAAKHNYIEAREQANIAEENRRIAERERLKALKSAEEEELQRKNAEENAALAEKNAAEAKKNLTEAKKQQEIAQAETEKAKQAEKAERKQRQLFEVANEKLEVLTAKQATLIEETRKAKSEADNAREDAEKQLKLKDAALEQVSRDNERYKAKDAETQRLIADANTGQETYKNQIASLQAIITVLENRLGNVKNADAYLRDALDYEIKDDLPSARENYLKAIKLFSENGNIKSKAEASRKLSGVYAREKKYSEAYNANSFALKFYRTEGDKLAEAQTIVETGMLFSTKAIEENNSEDIRKAISEFESAVAIYKQLGFYDKEQAKIYESIGEAYEFIDDFDNAIQSYTEAEKLYDRIDDDKSESALLSNIGFVYQQKADKLKNEKNSEDAHKAYNEALKSYNESLSIRIKLKDISGQISDLNNIGEIYRSLNQPDKALEYFRRAQQLQPDKRNEKIKQ
jgi:hypothetical protein